MKILRTSWTLGKWSAGCVRDLLLCALWLALAGLLALQIALIAAHRLPMPDWMLRQIESRLDKVGLHAQIGTATIDPAGRVVLDNLQLSPAATGGPLIAVDTLILRLSPWALLAGRVEARHVSASGVNFLLPALFSPTGRTEPVISGVSLAFKPDRDKLTLDQLTGRLANLTFSCHGTLAFPPGFPSDTQTPAQRNANVALAVKKYIGLCRQLVEKEPELQALGSPHLELRLTPIPGAWANVAITLTSKNASIDLTRFGPEAGQLQIDDLRASTALPLATTAPRTLQLRVGCAQIRSTTGSEARALLCDFTAELSSDLTQIEPRSLVATAESVRVHGVAFENTSARITPNTPPNLHADIVTQAIGTDWHVSADADPTRGLGSLSLEGALTPYLVELVEGKFGRPPGSLLKLSSPAPLSLSVEFVEGWKPVKTRGVISTGPAVAGSVPINAFQGNFSYIDNELNVTDIILHQGENVARGIYRMNTQSLVFRFLLTGQLRPIDIGGWFSDWWPGFWNHFDFAPAEPVADVTVDGQWGLPYLTNVFAGVDVDRLAIQGVRFDHVRAVMFIRPEFYDALELKVKKTDRSAQGTFTRTVDLTRDDDALRAMDFDLTSNLDLTETAKIFGPEGTDTIEPFTFAEPPSLHLAGHIDGPASSQGSHRTVQLGLQSRGAFALYDFPLNDLSFHGTIRDADIDLNDIQVSFARGQAQGRAYLSGPDAERRLSFDFAIEGANIGETIATLEQFFAKQSGEPPSPTSRFQQQLSDGRLNLQLAAQGLYRDPLSFRGQGAFELSGEQLARINLFGALSKELSKSPLFSFTAIQLKSAHANFSLDRQLVDFPDLKIIGTTASVETKGTFLLDKKLMDFSAKVYPFGHGKTLLANAVGFVLVPISNALELKLSGTLDQPNWRFAYGPTNLLYNLTGTNPNETDPNQPSEDTKKKLSPIYLRH
jgi:hypothetical protein